MNFFSEDLKANCAELTGFFSQAISKNKLANAYLFCGQEPAMRDKLWRELAMILNCQTGDACGKCRNCKWILANEHPEVPYYLQPDTEKSKRGVILLAQVQQLLARMQQVSPFQRFFCIPDATGQVLVPAAANALLKTIEQVPARNYFLLFARDPEAVLPTITSRCQILHLPASTKNEEQTPLSQEEIDEFLLVPRQTVYVRARQTAEKYKKLPQVELLELLARLEVHIIQRQELALLADLQRAEERLRAFCNPSMVLQEMLLAFWDKKRKARQ